MTRSRGIQARSILWRWTGDSRLRRRSTRRQGLETTGGAGTAPSFRVVAPCASPDRPAPPAGALSIQDDSRGRYPSSARSPAHPAAVASFSSSVERGSVPDSASIPKTVVTDFPRLRPDLQPSVGEQVRIDLVARAHPEVFEHFLAQGDLSLGHYSQRDGHVPVSVRAEANRQASCARVAALHAGPNAFVHVLDAPARRGRGEDRLVDVQRRVLRCPPDDYFVSPLAPLDRGSARQSQFAADARGDSNPGPGK